MDNTHQRISPNKCLNTIFSLFLLLLILVQTQAQDKQAGFSGRRRIW